MPLYKQKTLGFSAPQARKFWDLYLSTKRITLEFSAPQARKFWGLYLSTKRITLEFGAPRRQDLGLTEHLLSLTNYHDNLGSLKKGGYK